MGRRRQARENALHALYLVDTASTPPELAFAWVHDRREADPATLEFTRALFEGTLAHRAEIDARLEKTATNWALARMAAVDRNILRLAAFELLHNPETPIRVVIDEALEIARKFSTEESTSFINGILDQLKDRRPADNVEKRPL